MFLINNLIKKRFATFLTIFNKNVVKTFFINIFNIKKHFSVFFYYLIKKRCDNIF
jgi:hypothetical protein